MGSYVWRIRCVLGDITYYINYPNYSLHITYPPNFSDSTGKVGITIVNIPSKIEGIKKHRTCTQWAPDNIKVLPNPVFIDEETEAPKGELGNSISSS